MRRLSTALLVTILITAAPTPASARPSQVGLVLSADGDVQLERGGNSRAIASFPTVLRAGDVVLVQSSGSEAVLQLAHESGRRVLTMSDSPFEAKKPTQTESLTGSLYAAWLQVRRAVVYHSSDQSISLATLGDDEIPPLEVPLLRAPAILAEQQKLSLGWKGGRPPFSVVLRSPNGKAVTLIPTARNPSRLVESDVDLTSGSYHVKIADVEGRIAHGRIEVHELGTSEPPELDTTGLSEDLALVQRAAVIMLQSNGTMSLRAYQLVAPIADRDPAARAVRNSLEAGNFLPFTD